MAKKLFDRFLSGGESLFLNEVALDYNYQPKLIPHRDSEQFYMADCIKPLFSKRNGKNLFIYGPPGVGKTVCIKHVLNEIIETTDEVIPVYVNCWKKETSHKMAVEICDQIGYKFTHNKSTDELINEISRILNKKSAVFAFDEFDKMNDQDTVYLLLEGIYRKTIFLIANSIECLPKLDSRLRSRLMLDKTEFKPYNLTQLKDILKQRKDIAFVKDIFKEDAFGLIVNETFKINDVRTGLYLLKEAGNIAESQSSREVLLEHAKIVISKLDRKHEEANSNEDILILNLVKENSGKTMNELYSLYKGLSDKSYKTFQRRIKALSEKEEITLEKAGSAQGALTYIVKYSH